MKIYLDNAATTKIADEVLEEMLPYLKDNYGNASSIHSLGQKSREAIDTSREKIAEFLNCSPIEVIFTGTATESNNLAILGVVKKEDHVITSNIEHPAVLEACKASGCEVTYLSVSSEGIVSLDDLREAIKENTALVSIMYANNEIGTIQPIKEIGELLKDKDILFHCDAVQAVNYLNCDVKELNVDLLTMSAHKIYGPKGIGVLYVKKGVKLNPLIVGGKQELSLRPGTENTALIVGFSKAIEMIKKSDVTLRDRLISGILEKIPKSSLNGSSVRLPNNVNMSFEGAEGEAIVISLNEEGIMTSTGSACSSGSLDPSYVLRALGLTDKQAHGSLRLTLGRETTEKEIDYVLEVLPKVIENLRKISGSL